MSLASELADKINDLPDEGSSGDLLPYVHVDEQKVSSNRWTERFRLVYLLPDGSYLAVEETEGLTEMQDGIDPSATAEEVFPQEVTVIRYYPLEEQ